MNTRLRQFALKKNIFLNKSFTNELELKFKFLKIFQVIYNYLLFFITFIKIIENI
jgi:hypothetical protein